MKDGSLQGVALLSGFPDSERRVLEAVFVEQRVPRGHVFFREGDLARAGSSAVYLILSGEVAAERERPSAEGVIAPPVLLRSGDLFGIVGLATDLPRTASCIAQTETVVAMLTRPTFMHLREQHTRLAARFELMLARQLVRDLRALTGGLVKAFRSGFTADYAAIRDLP